MAQFVQAAINKGRPLHVDGLEGVLPVPEILLRSLGYRWKDEKVVCVVDTARQLVHALSVPRVTA